MAPKPFSTDEIVTRVAKAACKRICRRLISHYRRMPYTLSGDDSPLANVWEEICVQEQQERGFSWEEAYEPSLLGFLEGELDTLDEATRWAIWHQTDAGIDWSVDDNEPPEEWSSEELARFILEDYVLPAAAEYSNARIRRYIEHWEGDCNYVWLRPLSKLWVDTDNKRTGQIKLRKFGSFEGATCLPIRCSGNLSGRQAISIVGCAVAMSRYPALGIRVSIRHPPNS